MSSSQQSLIAGDVLAQHRFVVESILSDALNVIYRGPDGDAEALTYFLEQQLTIVRQCADELRLVGSTSTDVPF